jgi:hypothetical protein
MGIDAQPFAVAVMFGCAASFATPIGYQTNTYVFGAGWLLPGRLPENRRAPQHHPLDRRQHSHIRAEVINSGPSGGIRRALTNRVGPAFVQRSTIDDVHGALLHVERGFANCFAQGRVRMTRAADVFGAAAEFNYRNRFGD